MKPLVQLSRTGPMRRFGRFVEKRARRGLEACLDLIWPVPENSPLVDQPAVRKILFVRPNFRIGNTVLATAFLPALQARFPEARLEYLAGDTTVSLLEGLPIARVHCVSRRFIVAPWGFVALFVRLRRERFDLAVDGGIGSYSGGLYAFLSGARQRLGGGGRGDRFLTVRLEPLRIKNAYEAAPAFARALGVTCSTRPMYRVSAAEDAAALALLHGLGLEQAGVVRPFVAVFVGGHLEKRWPQSEWSALIEQLDRAGLLVVVFVGPEEIAFGARQAATRPSLRIVPPQPLRAFAALLAHATLVVTPDSGPLHLAVALGVPTIALLQQKRSRFYAPQGAEDRALFRPSCAEVVAALQAHPRWALLAPAA